MTSWVSTVATAVGATALVAAYALSPRSGGGGAAAAAAAPTPLPLKGKEAELAKIAAGAVIAANKAKAALGKAEAAAAASDAWRRVALVIAGGALALALYTRFANASARKKAWSADERGRQAEARVAAAAAAVREADALRHDAEVQRIRAEMRAAAAAAQAEEARAAADRARVPPQRQASGGGGAPLAAPPVTAVDHEAAQALARFEWPAECQVCLVVALVRGARWRMCSQDGVALCTQCACDILHMAIERRAEASSAAAVCGCLSGEEGLVHPERSCLFDLDAVHALSAASTAAAAAMAAAAAAAVRAGAGAGGGARPGVRAAALAAGAAAAAAAGGGVEAEAPLRPVSAEDVRAVARASLQHAHEHPALWHESRCPLEGCGAVLVAPRAVQARAPVRTCHGCTRRSCTLCRKMLVAGFHEGRSCAEAAVAAAAAAAAVLFADDARISLGERAQRLRLSIVERDLPVRCPRCAQPFVEFDGCLALVCSSCGCGFCALCLQDCGGDAHNHFYATHGRGNEIFNRQRYHDTHRQRRTLAIATAVRALAPDAVLQRAVVAELAKADLRDLNISAEYVLRAAGVGNGPGGGGGAFGGGGGGGRGGRGGGGGVDVEGDEALARRLQAEEDAAAGGAAPPAALGRR